MRHHRIAALLLLSVLLTVPVLAAEAPSVYCFSDLSEEDPELRGVWIAAAPDCTLTLGSRTIRPGDTLTVTQLEALQAAAHTETDTVAAVSYLPIYDDHVGARQTLYLSLRGSKNQPPVARDSKAETYKNLAVTGTLDCSDPEDGALVYLLKTSPKRGQVVFNRDGTFTYTPNQEKVGEDFFTYAVEDEAGNVSEEATVRITIHKPVCSGVFADMAGDPQEFEALFLRNSGLFSGETVGGVLCFGPDKPVSQEEFLMMLMKLTGLPPEAEAAGTDWFAPWQTAALRAGIAAGVSSDFTGLDAAVLTAGVLDLPAELSVEVFSEEPSSAETACLRALEKAGITCFTDSAAGAVTRRDAARMLYAIHRYCEDQQVTFPWQTS